MKVALLLILGLSAKLAGARPLVDDFVFNCYAKPQVDSGWEKTGAATISMDSQGLHVEFGATGLSNIQTTSTPSEYQAEARCSGYVVLHDTKPFKIRDLAFQENFASIQSNDGKIELVSKGSVVNAKDETDEFDKNWTIKLSALKPYNEELDTTKKAKINPFAAKGESKTLCATELTLRFDDVRGLVQRKQNQANLESSIELRQLLVTFDPC